MSTLHDDQHANVGGYVLGILDAEERRAFEAHLARCAACAAELASLRPVAAALATTVPQVTPRPELRDRLLASMREQHRVTRPQVRPTTQTPSLRGWLPIAAAVALAVGMAIYAAGLYRQVADLQGRLDQAQSSTAVLSAPDLARVDLQGQMAAPDARARALWSRSRGLVFSVANLPPLPAGKVYQVWVVTAQAPISAGLLVPDMSGGGTSYYMTPSDIAPPVAVAVTLEPAGGVPSPTGDKYLVGTL